MIFQQWVMEQCSGRPSEAIRRLTAANGGREITRHRVYRALRAPVAFPLRFAQLVIAASGGACTLTELIDLETIRERFEYTNPEARLRSLEYQIVCAEKRREARRADAARAADDIAAAEAELAELRAKLAAFAHATLPADDAVDTNDAA
jgi:hypothetical protein